jgi:hypothetical protein
MPLTKIQIESKIDSFVKKNNRKLISAVKVNELLHDILDASFNDGSGAAEDTHLFSENKILANNRSHDMNGFSMTFLKSKVEFRATDGSDTKVFWIRRHDDGYDAFSLSGSNMISNIPAVFNPTSAGYGVAIYGANYAALLLDPRNFSGGFGRFGLYGQYAGFQGYISNDLGGGDYNRNMIHWSNALNTPYDVVGLDWHGTNSGSGGNYIIKASHGDIKLPTSGNGTKIGTSTNEKFAFWGSTPQTQQVLATATGKSVDDVITFLQSIGLCRQS